MKFIFIIVPSINLSLIFFVAATFFIPLARFCEIQPSPIIFPFSKNLGPFIDKKSLSGISQLWRLDSGVTFTME